MAVICNVLAALQGIDQRAGKGFHPLSCKSLDRYRQNEFIGAGGV